MDKGENLDRIGRAMMAAWSRVKKAQSRMWGEWMTIGEGLLEGRRWAMHQASTNKPEGKAFVMAYSEWLKRYRVDDMDKSDRAKLLQLMEERPGVEEWRAALPNHERRNLNNPVVVWRKWTAATRVKKPKPRSAGVSATEHGRAQHTIEELQARNEELEHELAATRETGGNPEVTLRELLKNKGPHEIVDSMLATLSRYQLEEVSKELAEIIAEERHLAITSSILKKGTLVKLRGSKGQQTVIEDPGPAEVTNRLVRLQPDSGGAPITGRRDWIYLR
jgi:hypothetical protein